MPALELLKGLRQSQGLKVAIIDVDDIYDEFSFGQKSPQSVKDFLSYAASNWNVAPRYGLFGGRKPRPEELPGTGGLRRCADEVDRHGFNGDGE